MVLLSPTTNICLLPKLPVKTDNLKIIIIPGEKSNDKNNPDYIPSVNMGYKDTKPSGDLRHARHLRLEGRESEKGKKQAASALLDLSNTENIFETQAEELQPHVDIHSGCIKKIAALRIENQQLYEELGRLQTENAILKQNESRLSFEEQMTSSDQRIQFYTGLGKLYLYGCCHFAHRHFQRAKF
ncbi:uncharacterized protein LOC121392148 [Gigantopelta aegis]|uniref:uncharacterized protein LOC121392148 n=1 Tax=Gigantopelta aegis TaxID=1735272 RepID=UPI001B888F1C|nr:uncharacterized protein LOC121392148 [Gigantopelta aegis]